MDILDKTLEILLSKEYRLKVIKGLPNLLKLISLFLLFLIFLSAGYKYLSEIEFIKKYLFLIDNEMGNFLKPSILIFLSIILTFWFVKLYFRYRENTSGGDFELSSSSIKDWVFQGMLSINKDILRLNYSDSGCIIKDKQWKNYRMTFAFRLEKINGEKGFGIILRARDLENYIMLKLDDTISPHIRMDKVWERIVPEDLKLTICDEKWHDCEIVMQDNVAILFLDKEKVFSYNLPTHSGIAYFKTGAKEPTLTISGELIFRDSGSIGFRAWGYVYPQTESVLIKDLKIKNL